MNCRLDHNCRHESLTQAPKRHVQKKQRGERGKSIFTNRDGEGGGATKLGLACNSDKVAKKSPNGLEGATKGWP